MGWQCSVIFGKVLTMNGRKDDTWFRAKVAELKVRLEGLPPERQEQFGRELEAGGISGPSGCLGPSQGVPSGRVINWPILGSDEL